MAVFMLLLLGIVLADKHQLLSSLKAILAEVQGLYLDRYK